MDKREPTWRARADVAWTGEAPRYVVMGLSRPEQQPVALEGPAALVWAALWESPGGEGAVVRRVAELAGVPEDIVAGHVGEFLRDLESRGLAERY